MQQAEILYEAELGKVCVKFLCEYCEKTIIKPLIYVRDERVSLVRQGLDTELNVLHDCGNRYPYTTTVLISKEKHESN